MKFIINDNNDKKLLITHLQALGNNYVVEVKQNKNTRSMNQNKYYWKCIVQGLAKELGYNTDEMHDALKVKFSSEWSMIQYKDKTIAMNNINSTTQMNTKEFEEYCEQIRIWAITDLGIRLRAPNEYQQ
jgi:energy-converting hydrogenase A subunit M